MENRWNYLIRTGYTGCGCLICSSSNTEFTCSNYGLDTSKDSTIHKKIFIAYPTEYKVGERIKLLLTPGDSIIQDKEAFTNTHTYRYEGRGSEQNNLQYNTQRFSYYNSEYGNISPDELKKSASSTVILFFKLP